MKEIPLGRTRNSAIPEPEERKSTVRARKAGTQRSLLTILDTIQNIIVTAISEKERNLRYVITVNSYMGSYKTICLR